MYYSDLIVRVISYVPEYDSFVFVVDLGHPEDERELRPFGGKWERQDPTPADTAVREGKEETLMDLSEHTFRFVTSFGNEKGRLIVLLLCIVDKETVSRMGETESDMPFLVPRSRVITGGTFRGYRFHHAYRRITIDTAIPMIDYLLATARA